LTAWNPFGENIPTIFSPLLAMNDITERACNARSPTANATTVT